MLRDIKSAKIRLHFLPTFSQTFFSTYEWFEPLERAKFLFGETVCLVKCLCKGMRTLVIEVLAPNATTRDRV